MATQDLDGFVEQYHKALDEFFRGNPEPAKLLYSHRDDATLANPFGPIATGWEQVASTMELAAANYRAGRTTAFERLAICVTPGLAYMVELERFETHLGGRDAITSGALRVTTVLRPEDGAWKIVHRHADPITGSRPAESVASA